MRKPAYSFSPDTGAFTGQTMADESPLEPGVFHLPAHATFDAPPDAGDAAVPVWTGSTWELRQSADVTPAPKKPEPTWDTVRARRNMLLSASDWTQLPDSSADQQAWAAYRKALRDITKGEFANKVKWPTQPL